MRAVVLIGGGEPMAHPKFSPLVEALHSNNIKIGVTTNGTLIERHFDVCANMTNWLRVLSMLAAAKFIKNSGRTRAASRNLISLSATFEKLAKQRKGLVGYSFLFTIKV